MSQVFFSLQCVKYFSDFATTQDLAHSSVADAKRQAYATGNSWLAEGPPKNSWGLQPNRMSNTSTVGEYRKKKRIHAGAFLEHIENFLGTFMHKRDCSHLDADHFAGCRSIRWNRQG